MTRTLPYRGISIQFPGGSKRYNAASEPYAAQIVDLAADHGYEMIDFHQFQGGADIPAENGYIDNAELAALRAMPPHIPGHPISENARESIYRAKERRMFMIGYTGACWCRDDGTPEHRERRYQTQRDMRYLSASVHDMAAYGFNLIVLDDISKGGSLLGQPNGKTFGNPAEDAVRSGKNPRQFLIRDGDPYPIRWRTMVSDTYNAAVAGAGATPVGVEPDPRASWVGEQLPPSVPFMQVCELVAVKSYRPNDKDRLGILILNDHTAGYTLADINEYHWRCASLGYSSLVTWWVWKIALKKAGITVPGG